MQAEELLTLVKEITRQKTEWQSVALKAAAKGCPSRLYNTLSSFSNQDSGGIIILGVDEAQDYDIVGVYDPQDLQKKVTEQRTRDDIRVVEGARLTLFHKERPAKYLAAATQERKNLAQHVTEQEILELMGATVDSTPTVAGIMTFSLYPQAYFPQLCITAAAIPGKKSAC